MAHTRLPYLTWSVCWDKLKDLYPTATHEWVMYSYDGKPYAGIVQPDGTITVHCKITYETQDGNSYTHNEYLAVRDNRLEHSKIQILHKWKTHTDVH